MITLNPARLLTEDRLKSSPRALHLGGGGLPVPKIEDPEPKIKDPGLKIKDLGLKVRTRSHKRRIRSLELRIWAEN